VDATTVRLKEPGSLLCLASGGVSEACLTRFFEDSPSSLDDEAVAGCCRAAAQESGAEATIVVMRVGKAVDEPAVLDFGGRTRTSLW